MLVGNRSIVQIFSRREIYDTVPSIQASMTKSAMEDLTGCLHYSDDWEPMGDDNWDDVYDYPKVEADPSTASHQLMHGILEDGYNKVCNVLLLVVFHLSLSLNFPPSLPFPSSSF
jgi:hypothetical protein